MIPVTCPTCGATTNCPDEQSGRTVPCSGCGTKITVAAGGLGGFGGYGAQQEPAKKKRSGGPLPTWALVLGGVVTVVLVAGVVYLISPKPKPAAVAEEPAAKPNEPKKGEKDKPAEGKSDAKPAAPKGMAIEPISDVVLDQGGTAKVTVKVQRGGVKGGIAVRAEGLPDQVSAEAVEIAEDQETAELVFMAAAEAPPTKEPVKVKLIAEGGEKNAQQELTLAVKPPLPPVFSPLAALTIKPGTSTPLELKIDRKGYEQSIPLTVEGLPEKVKLSKRAANEGAPTEGAPSEGAPSEPEAGGELALAEGESSLKLTLSAAADAAEGQSTPKIVATVREQRLEAPLKLTIERFAVRLHPLPVITLKPGESKTIDVIVERRSFTGALKLAPQGLPEKVTAGAIEVPAGQSTAKLEVTAAADAPEQVKSAALANAAGTVELKEALVVRVAKTEGSFLTAEATADPELARTLRRGAMGGRLETPGKQALLRIYGGTPESEAAVLKGLAWLAQKQAEDGHWAFEASEAAAAGGEGEPPATSTAAQGQEGSVAATAFGVLPFLGAGVTHKQSPSEPAVLKEYRPKVLSALQWLGKQQIVTREDPKKDGELPGGIAAHALGTLAICEAYAISNDDKITVAAQRAVKHLLQTQNKEGGWSDDPAKPGDVATVGWVVLALRSGREAGLTIDKAVFDRIGKFLNTCAAGPEEAKLSRYSPAPDQAAQPMATAAGLLSRQHLGWERNNANLLPGSQYLMLMENLPPEAGSQLGPIAYYQCATEVLRNLEGENWDKWNHHLREHLLRTQEKEGSWSPVGADDIGSKAGRVSATSLSLLTLESYYRHLPLYRRATKVAEAR
jgi:hypothetical protein